MHITMLSFIYWRLLPITTMREKLNFYSTSRQIYLLGGFPLVLVSILIPNLENILEQIRFYKLNLFFIRPLWTEMGRAQSLRPNGLQNVMRWRNKYTILMWHILRKPKTNTLQSFTLSNTSFFHGGLCWDKLTVKVFYSISGTSLATFSFKCTISCDIMFWLHYECITYHK